MSDIWEKLERLRNAADEVKEFARMEGTEYGEWCSQICYMATHDVPKDSLITEELLEKEVYRILEDFKTNWEVEEVVVPPTPASTYKTLNYIGE